MTQNYGNNMMAQNHGLKKIKKLSLLYIFFVIVDEFEGSECQSPFDSSLERSGNEMGYFR